MAVEVGAKLDALARSQHGVVTSEQAVKALGPSRKARWVAERRLLSVQPGVFRLAGSRPTWHQSLQAAALAAEGVVSHRSAAELWGLIKPAGYLEVSVGEGGNPRLRPPAIVHRIGELHPSLVVDREGMRVTDALRTVADLGLVLPRWAVGDALSRGLTTRLFQIGEVQELREALRRSGRNAAGVVEELFAHRLLRAATDARILEARLVELIGRHDLPEASFQHEVWHAGRFVSRIDAAYPELLLAIEVEGDEHHRAPEAFQRDRARRGYLVALGWTVLRFSWDDVVHSPGSVAQTISAALSRLRAA